jgi:hypothetical protein
VSYVCCGDIGHNVSDSQGTIYRHMTIEEVAAYASVATAVGTLSLAAATYYLARGASAEVVAATAQARATAEQSAASLEQSKASTRQAAAAEQALTAQTAPLLSDVPFGIPVVSGYRTKPNPGSPSIMDSLLGHREPTYRDASEIAVYVDENGLKDANIRVPFRNVGNGVAIVQDMVFFVGDETELGGASSVPVIPTGQVAEAELSILPSADGYEGARSVITKRTAFAVAIAYGDATGASSGAIRLDVAPTADSEADDWFVRQVHWGDTLAEARHSPRLSSRPVLA